MNLEDFVDEEVMRIVRKSSIYKYLKTSIDEDFADVSLSLCSVSVLCYLKTKHKKQLFTQKTLCDIVKIAARRLLTREGICKCEHVNA